MNTAQKKQLSRLILPCLILVVMVVLIIMAKARDAKKLENALNGSATTTTQATTTTDTDADADAADESSAPAPAAVKPGTAEASGDAVAASELENASVIFDGKVAVTYDTMNEEASTITVRIDNMYGEDLQTQGFPKTIVDGEEILLNPLGKNQKLNYTTIPAGQYILITYKVDARCFSATTLELTTGTLKVMSTGEIEYYDLIIK